MNLSDLKTIKCTLSPVPRLNEKARTPDELAANLEVMRKWCREAQDHISKLHVAIRLLAP